MHRVPYYPFIFSKTISRGYTHKARLRGLFSVGEG